MQIFIKKSNLYDEEGRQILLRGCNLGGSSKVPTTPNGATWRKDSLENPRAVSFVGRPFPLEEADMHV
ncbi:MAG: cytoplasm protein, partial [Treponemataceae bacterium]|nr:cytoplasm protein [Treponemataceae bacterium]